jgi:hypothetical protein
VNYRKSNSCRVESFRIKNWNRAAQLYSFIANQIAKATITTMITAHTIGVTRFELPLRGESLTAWLNSRFI